MDPNLPTVDFRDFWLLAPAIVLSAWGLVVLLADLALAGRMSAVGPPPDDRLADARGRGAGVTGRGGV